MIKMVKFVSIPTTDQDRALAFWTGKMGFRVVTDQPMGETQRWIELGIPGAETGVVLFTPDGQPVNLLFFLLIGFVFWITSLHDRPDYAGTKGEGSEIPPEFAVAVPGEHRGPSAS